MAAKKQTAKAKASGYSKGSVGYDSKGNRVSVNSPGAVTVGNVKGGLANSVPNTGVGSTGVGSAAASGAQTPAAPTTSQAKEVVGGKVYDYTRSSNPSVTEANRKRAMGAAYRPPSSSVVATSDSARSAVEDATDYLTRSEKLQRAERERRRLQKEAAAAAAAAPGSESAGAATAASAQADKVTAMLGGMDDPTAAARAMIDANGQEQAQAAYQREVARVQKKLDTLGRDMDDRTSAIVDSINVEYESLMDEQRAANDAYEAGVVTAGMTSGRAQYAPEIQGGIVKAAMDQGIAKLEDLQNKRAKLVLEAEAARDERNYKLLTAKMDQVRQSYIDEREFARQLQIDIREAARFQKENNDYVGENLAPTLYAALTGDPAADAELYAEVANQTGVPPYVIKRHVEDYRKSLVSDAPGQVGEFIYLQQNGMLPSGVTSYAGYLSWKEALGRSGAGSGKTIGRDLANESGLTSLADASYDSFDRVALDGGGNFLESLGYDSDMLQQSVDSPSAPAWFKSEYERSYGVSPTGDELHDAWKKWKETPAAQEIRTGRRPSAASSGDITAEEIDALFK